MIVTVHDNTYYLQVYNNIHKNGKGTLRTVELSAQ